MLPASSIPVSLSVLLEDPHDDGPQEHEDTAYGEKLELSHHGSPPSFPELELCLKSVMFPRTKSLSQCENFSPADSCFQHKGNVVCARTRKKIHYQSALARSLEER